jgi:hypothetical protein
MRHGLGSVLLLLSLLVACSSQQGNPVHTYAMGDRVEVGPLIYNVFDTRWLTHLGEGSEGRIPQQRFCLVRLSVVNSGAKPTPVPTFQLVDDQGGTHDEISNGTGVPEWLGYLREIQPTATMQGNIVFDVPPAHYRLRVTEESESHVAMVDIPLQFQMDAPGVPESLPVQGPPQSLRSPTNR